MKLEDFKGHIIEEIKCYGPDIEIKTDKGKYGFSFDTYPDSSFSDVYIEKRER